MLASNKLSSHPSAPAIPPPRRYGGIIRANNLLATSLRAGDTYRIAGSGSIDRLPFAPAGTWFIAEFDGTPVIQHSAKLQCPFGSSYQINAGNVGLFFCIRDGIWKFAAFPDSRFVTNETIAATQSITTSGITNIDSNHHGKTLLLFPSTAGGDIGLQLTALANLPSNFFVRLIRVEGGANNVTVICNGAETCDGRVQSRLISQYDAATICKAGAVFVTKDARWRRRELVFDSSGSLDVLANVPLGCLDYEIEAVAAGSSGGGSKITGTQRQGGGGAGAWGRKRVLASQDDSPDFTIGAGGAPVAASASGTNSNPGGNTTVTIAGIGTLTLNGAQAVFVGGAGAIGGTPGAGWDESAKGEDGYTSESNGSQVGFGGSSRFGAGAKNNVGSPGGVGAGGSCSNHTSGSDMSGAGGNGRLLVHI
jgi:hypothetical protein